MQHAKWVRLLSAVVFTVFALLEPACIDRARKPIVESPSARIDRILESSNDEAQLTACQEYFGSYAARERNRSRVESIRSRCAQTFTHWFVGLPDQLDQITVARIYMMRPWLASQPQQGAIK